MTDEPETGEQEAVRTCRPCDRIWGAFGLLAGGALIYMGLDLLTGGALTRAITGTRELGEPDGGSEL
jgi:hypothetical protein